MKAWGTGSLYRRGGVWWIQYSYRGKVYRESSRSLVRADATRLLRQRQAEMARGRLVGRDPERVTFSDLVRLIQADYVQKQHRTWERVEHSLKHLRPVFERTPAIEITYDRVSHYITARLQEGAARGTVHHELAALSRMLKLAVLAGKLPVKPPLPTLRLDNVRTGFFSDAEVVRVLRELPAWYAPAIEFAWRTGWRIGEVKGLTWAQVDFKAGSVRLEPGTTKNREGRLFPISASPALRALLQRQWERTLAWQREHGQILPWVFWRSGLQLADHRDTWMSACKRAGVPGRLVHDLRRSAVRNLERAGVPRSAAMKITGHKTESVYRRYAIVSEADLVDAVARLEAFRSGSSTELTQNDGAGAPVDDSTPSDGSSTATGTYGAAGGSVDAERAAALPATHPVDQAHWKL
jgi:integrase